MCYITFNKPASDSQWERRFSAWPRIPYTSHICAIRNCSHLPESAASGGNLKGTLTLKSINFRTLMYSTTKRFDQMDPWVFHRFSPPPRCQCIRFTVNTVTRYKHEIPQLCVCFQLPLRPCLRTKDGDGRINDATKVVYLVCCQVPYTGHLYH